MIKDWLGVDGPIYNMLNRIGNLIGISILWLISCLPIITIGTAATALYYTTVKVLRRESGSILKEYFYSFKENLKNGTIMTVMGMVVAVVMYLDLSYVMGTNGNLGGLLVTIYYMIVLLIASILMYIFPNLSRFKMNKRGLLKLSFYMAFRHLPTTFLLLVMFLGTGILIWLIPVPMILIMPGILCYMNSFLIEGILSKYMAKPKEGSEEAHKWYYHIT